MLYPSSNDGHIFTCFEECILEARRLNILEISQVKGKIEKTNDEIKFLNDKIFELKTMNEALG